jgi:hypothetical protein
MVSETLAKNIKHFSDGRNNKGILEALEDVVIS